MGKAAGYDKDLFLDWEKIHQDSIELAARLRKIGEWKGIIGITRGGMMPACIVAQELDIKLVDTLCICSYDYQNMGNSNILKKPDIENDGEGWLIIDDLVDTGGTYKVARELFPKAHFATLYAKPKGTPTTDTFITEYSQDTWVHFPWEPSSYTEED